MTHNLPSNTGPNGSEPRPQPEPEVLPQAKRLTFTAAYKLRILTEAGLAAWRLM